MFIELLPVARSAFRKVMFRCAFILAKPTPVVRADLTGHVITPFVLFCPRCSRQVNNAHGVCGSCGECVFQCRRCRQIHYDRPDAFLCAECGHCSSGTFSFHLTAGVASNAIAIVDDESCMRTIKILSQAKKLYMFDGLRFCRIGVQNVQC